MRTLLICLALLGCANQPSVADFHNNCIEAFPDFIEATDCLTQSIRHSGMEAGPDGDLVTLYVSYANDLADRVAQQELSSRDAYYQIAEIYANMGTLIDRTSP